MTGASDTLPLKRKSLDKKWKELLFAFSGFGPNFLMVLMGAYFSDAINPVALGNESFQAIASGTCFILPLVFPILNAIGKVFDGVIDIPFGYITDTLSTKWGRRRPTIAVCFIPMVLSFAMCWFPIGGADGQTLNTIWIFLWSIVFFATYTMCLISFYGSLSTTCCDEPQRLRVSGFKSFFDTISYCLVYALVPLLLDLFHIHIDKFVFICLPLMLTMIIPLFLIKEGAKYGYPENEGLSPEKVSIWQSLKLTFGNRLFLRWTAVNCCTFFGLQMFLVGMNAMIVGGMAMSGAEMALLNTCAFAPVPICLYLFNKLKAKKGIRFAYQTCLLAFAVGIMSFFFGSTLVTGGNKTLQYIIGCAGGVIASWAIGSFFMMPYLVPAQVSSVEEKLTGKNHSAMYFAANAVTTSIVGAISGSLIYENIKNLFFSTSASGVKIAETYEKAAELFGVAQPQVFNLGTMLVPFIVCLTCLIGFALAFKMPKDFTPELVAKELKKFNPALDISEYENGTVEPVKEEKGEILFVQIGLSILSGFLFGFIWLGFMLKSLKELIGQKLTGLVWALSCLLPFVHIYYAINMHNQLAVVAKEKGVKLSGSLPLYIITGILFPLMPINVIALSVLQHDINKIYAADAAAEAPAQSEQAPAAEQA